MIRNWREIHDPEYIVGSDFRQQTTPTANTTNMVVLHTQVFQRHYWDNQNLLIECSVIVLIDVAFVG